MECNEWLCFGNSKWWNKKTRQQRAEEMQHLRTYCRNLSLRFTFAINKICHKFGAIIIVVRLVMEFITRGYKISYILFSEYMFVFRGNFCILWIDIVVASCRKLSMILQIKRLKNWSYQNTLFTKWFQMYLDLCSRK